MKEMASFNVTGTYKKMTIKRKPVLPQDNVFKKLYYGRKIRKK
jgi:hypothetical protein